ncbi:hypothetical protein M9Y10_030831 [Tritrichomonas musculus]|uniref:Beige/BEACH domain containing protein n=1 Tax=Tritrichomonas musculus TaxID=1915356 RepID=A0ABR2H357_9EUKA
MSKTSFEPSAEEISSSIYYIRVTESFTNFQNSYKSDNSIANFHSFLNDFNDFLSYETNKNLVKYYIQSVITKVIQFSSISAFNKDNFSLLFDILNKIFALTMDINFCNFPYFIISLMETNESIKMLSSHISTIEILFSNEKFFTSFAEQQEIQAFFDKSFIQLQSFDLCYLFRHLICEISPFELRREINLSKILSFLSTPIKHEIQIEYAIVLSKLVAANLQDRLFLNNNQNFILFSDLIQQASSETVIESFNDLIFTDPLNLDFLCEIFLFYQKFPQHQKSLFQWIFNDIVQNYPDMLHEINDKVPFYGWVTKLTPVSDAINSVVVLSKHDADFISPFLSPLFAILNKNGSKFEEFQMAVQIIEGQILLHKTSLLNLANINFLKTFVIDIDIDLLGQLFEKIYTFSQLVYDIYTLPKSEPLRPDVIDKLIQMCGKFPNNAQFLSIFLVISNSKKNISCLMKIIIENKNGDLCVALGNSFVKNETVVKYFVNENGIEWLNKVFNDQIINLHQFTFLINSLTKNAYINEVDKYIESLPKDHPIFTISQEDLMTLSYGFENSYHFYPLKITSLFHLLKCPQTIDPYNAYMLGKHFFDKIQNKEEFPILNEIVNRYINDESFQKIIEMPASNFERFCDSKFDHFPLFQINEFFDNNTFDVNFKGISFWFKFSDTFKRNVKIPFFISEKLQIFMKNSSIYANYDGTEYGVFGNPFKWNHIIVNVVYQKNAQQYIDVYVNLIKASFAPSHPLFELTDFEFSTFSAFLFIGPAIRIYQNDKISNDNEVLYKNGPSFLGHLNESFIITPSLLKNYFQFNKNTFPVEYRGFPFHFSSGKKKNLFINQIANSNLKENEFLLIMTTCFKIYSILKDSFYNFLPFLLTIYSKVPQFVNINILFKSFDFFLNCKPKNEIIDEIVSHKQFWSNVPHDVIIVALYQTFNEFDFYKEKKKLEIFFCMKSVDSNGNQKLFEYLYQSKYCQIILNKLFNASHFILNKQDKFTQCNLNTEISSQQEDLHEVVIDDENNVSIQCNLANNNSYNMDSICLFQRIKNNEFQRNFALFLNKMIIKTRNINTVPLSSIYGLFITSNIRMRFILYPILLNCERIAPNSVQFDSTFLCVIPPMFVSRSVWTETFNLLTGETNDIKKTSLLPVIFALLWGYAVASIHSVASTGSQNSNDDEIKRIINVLSSHSNIKIISNDKNISKFILSWFPYLLGVDQSNQEKVSNNEGITSQIIKLNGKEVTSPSVFCFMSMIWRNVVYEAKLPNLTKSEYYTNLQTFIVRSFAFKFYFILAFSMSDSILSNFLGAFFSIPSISGNNEMTNCFVGYFTHSLLNIVAESLPFALKIHLILPFIHFVCLNGHINIQYLPIILSDIFLVSSIIDISNNNFFQKLSSSFNILFMNLFITIIKICDNDDYDKTSFIDIINILYQVLHQYIHYFTKILNESQIPLDFYFQFFKKSSQFCSNKESCTKVINEFRNSLSAEQNQQFQSLLDGEDKFETEKWSDFVNSNINQNKMNFISFSYQKELSKSFTAAFLNEIKKQHDVSETLQHYVNETENINIEFENCEKNLNIEFNLVNHNIQ